jgi:hypothetical protein
MENILTIYLFMSSRFLASISLLGRYFGRSDGLQAYGAVLKYYKRHNVKHKIRITSEQAS